MSFDWKNEYHRYAHYFLDFKKIGQSAKTRSFAWISLTIFTISFFLIVAIQPTLITITSLNREIKDKKEASSQLQKKIDSIIQAQEEFAKNVDNFQLLDEALPTNNQFPSLALFLETLSADKNVVLKSLNFEKIQMDEKKPAKIPPDILGFQLTISGDYQALKSFLAYLEASRRIIKTDSISFSQTKVEEGKELSLTISGSAYFLKI